MNITNRLLLCGIVLASLASACTAIVLGKTSDSSDYGTSDTTSSSSSSSSSGAAEDPCSILDDNYTAADANACSDCINAGCAEPVAYFCSDGKPAPYLSTLQNCAQNPWNGRSPPGSGASFYGCTKFATTTEVPNDPSSEGAHEATANNCINSKCMQGGAPPCRLCEVSIKKPGSGSEFGLLRDDACGSCVAKACAAELSTCCDSQPMNDFVQYCAYTALSSNKAACLELGQSTPDAGDQGSRYSAEDTQCLTSLQGCFASCKSKCEAVTSGQ